MGAASTLQSDKCRAHSKQAVTFSDGAQQRWPTHAQQAAEPRKKYLNVIFFLLLKLFQARTEQG